MGHSDGRVHILWRPDEEGCAPTEIGFRPSSEMINPRMGGQGKTWESVPTKPATGGTPPSDLIPGWPHAGDAGFRHGTVPASAGFCSSRVADDRGVHVTVFPGFIFPVHSLLPVLMLMLVGWVSVLIGFLACALVACAGMSLVATGWAALSVKFSAMMLRSNVSDRFHARVVAFLCAWVPLRCGPSRYRWPAIRSYSCDPQRKLAWMELHYCDKIVTDYYLLIYSDHNFEHFSKKSTGR